MPSGTDKEQRSSMYSANQRRPRRAARDTGTGSSASPRSSLAGCAAARRTARASSSSK